MPVEPVELEACGQEGGVTSPSFYYFTLLFFYIGACNSPDKLLTNLNIYPTIPRIHTRVLLSIPKVRNMVLKFRPKKSSCIFISTSSWVRGAGGGKGGAVWLKG